MTDEELAELQAHLEALTTETVWQPLPGPQTLAYHSEADVLGYGGAAGGGKTDLLLGLAMTQHRKAILFRRRFTDLVDVVERGDAIQDGACSFVWGIKRRWDTPDGRQIELGAVEHEADKTKYKGRPHDFIGIDEAVDFPETIFRFITGWLRTTETAQRTRIVLTFNPPTDPAGEWIVQYFAPWLDDNHPNPAAPGELRWYAHIDGQDVEVSGPEPFVQDGATYTPQSRTFIPARVEDNPYLMATDYPTQLNNLPEPLRTQLRYGLFNVAMSDHPWQCIPTEWVRAAQARWTPESKPALSMRSIGVDVARGGGDETTIAPLYGTWFDELKVYPGSATPDGPTVGRYVTDAMGRDNPPVYVDVIGYGASAYDSLKDLPGVTAIPVNNSSGSDLTDRSGRYGFSNLRAESYWKLREALDPQSGENIALPPARQLRVDLCAPRYKIVGGKIALESKDDIKKRTGRSPDYGDAVVLAWYGAYRPRNLVDFA